MKCLNNLPQDSLLQHLPGAGNTGAASDPAAAVCCGVGSGVGGDEEATLGLDSAGHTWHCILVSLEKR